MPFNYMLVGSLNMNYVSWSEQANDPITGRRQTRNLTKSKAENQNPWNTKYYMQGPNTKAKQSTNQRQSTKSKGRGANQE